VEYAHPSAPSGVVDAAAINRAPLLLAPVVRSTPLERCERLSIATGAPVLFKREATQAVRSFKVRGACNLIASLPEDARAKGVVCASAGNHAQGVAFSCAALGIPGRVFLPATTPRQKRDRIRAIGGNAAEICTNTRRLRAREAAVTEPNVEGNVGRVRQNVRWTPGGRDRDGDQANSRR
jgi:threonine dehydratase